MLPQEKSSEDKPSPSILIMKISAIPLLRWPVTLETIRMGRVIEDMLQESLTAIETRDTKLSQIVISRDDEVDKLHEAIKPYARLTTEELDNAESQRATNILTFTTDLEHIGDIRDMMNTNERKIAEQLDFSDEGFAEIKAMHSRVTDSLQLAIGTFVSNDPKLASQLLDEKGRAADGTGWVMSHMERLGQQRQKALPAVPCT